jgi:hypothetical protein
MVPFYCTCGKGAPLGGTSDFKKDEWSLIRKKESLFQRKQRRD